MITKQECMVLLAQLPLVISTEMFEKVRLSGDVKITTMNKSSKTILQQYKNRKYENEKDSLHQFFYKSMKTKAEKCKRDIIPHYVGANVKAIYPPTLNYARSMLFIHQHWRGSQIGNSSNYIDLFNEFIKSPNCPKSLLLSYDRARMKHAQRFIHQEQIANETSIRDDEMLQEDYDLLQLIGKHISNTENEYKWPFGENFDWSNSIVKVRTKIQSPTVIITHS